MGMPCVLCVTHSRKGGCGMEKQAVLICGKVCGAVSQPLPLRIGLGWWKKCRLWKLRGEEIPALPLRSCVTSGE